MYSENGSEDGSDTHLVKAPKKRMASPLNQDIEDLLEGALDETSSVSFI